MSASPSSDYHKFMDGLRAIAALWVMYQHIVYHFLYRSNEFFITLKPWVTSIILRIGLKGNLGVDIFFVLSGFLITGILLKDFNGQIRLKRFYAGRFLKIFPHYLLILIIGIVICGLMKLSCQINNQSVAGYILFLQNYTPSIRIFRHLWSLSVEMHFYLLYPIVLSLICMFIKEPDTRRRALLWSLLLLLILGNVIRYFWYFDPLVQIDARVRQVSHIRFDGLIWGCLIKVLEPNLLSLPSRTRRLLCYFFFIAGVLIFLALTFFLEKKAWFDYTLAYFAAGSIILAGLLRFHPLNFILELPLLRWLGKNSYGIYLWGYILVYPFAIVLLKLRLIETLILYIGLTIGLAAFTTMTVEQYFLNKKQKWI